MKFGGTALGGLKARRAVGKSNKDTAGSDQKSPTTTPGATQAAGNEPAAGAVGSSSSAERALADPHASPVAKRAAQRQIASDKKAIRADQRDTRTAARLADHADGRPQLEEHLTARIAGGAQVGWQATKTAATDLALDAQRHASDIAHHPSAAAKQTARRMPKRAVTAAAVVGAATVAGLPGVAAVGGVLAAKKTTQLVRRQIHTNRRARENALDVFRQRRDDQEANEAAEDEWAQAVTGPITPDTDKLEREVSTDE